MYDFDYMRILIFQFNQQTNEARVCQTAIKYYFFLSQQISISRKINDLVFKWCTCVHDYKDEQYVSEKKLSLQKGENLRRETKVRASPRD